MAIYLYPDNNTPSTNGKAIYMIQTLLSTTKYTQITVTKHILFISEKNSGKDGGKHG